MAKDASPRADALRAMREANFAAEQKDRESFRKAVFRKSSKPKTKRKAK